MGSPLRGVLEEACAAAGVGRKVTPHGLRHTANDLLRRVASAEVTRTIVFGEACLSVEREGVGANQKKLCVLRAKRE